MLGPLCPLSSISCSVSSASCPVPLVQCLLFSASYPLLFVQCNMCTVTCFVSPVQYFLSSVSCPMFFMYPVRCFLSGSPVQFVNPIFIRFCYQIGISSIPTSFPFEFIGRLIRTPTKKWPFFISLQDLSKLAGGGCFDCTNATSYLWELGVGAHSVCCPVLGH